MSGLFRRGKGKHRAVKCRVDEEWQGLFIGRRYCSTHQVRWDDGGLCPTATGRKVWR